MKGLVIPENLVGGKPVRTGKMLRSVNPWNDGDAGVSEAVGPAEIAAALTGATAGFGQTRALTSARRSEILLTVSRQIAAHRDQFARLICTEVGKPLTLARLETDRAVHTFAIAAEETKRIGGDVLPMDLNEASSGRTGIVRRFPVGVVLGISPFNFPLNLVAHKLAPAMAAGNAFILKPASRSARTALALGQIVVDAGYPAEAVSVLPCGGADIDPLVSDDRVGVLTFTGSAPVGWKLKARAGRKKVVLELGGNAGVIVDETADLDDAVKRLAGAAFGYAGQVCIKTQRVYVHDTVYDEFRQRFVREAESLPTGDPSDPSTVVGPMIDDENAARVEAWIAEAVGAGGRKLTGRKRDGRVVPPVVLENVPASEKVVCEEVFGPVVVLERFTVFDEAIAAVNKSPYGLQAGVFTNDLRNAWRAYERLEVGAVILNDSSSYRIDHMPYGGVKLSGFGREGVRYAIESMTEPRLFVVRT